MTPDPPVLDKLDPFKRVQELRFSDMFPIRRDGLCACGCGEALEGRRTRWASDECSRLAVRVYGVYVGRSGAIRSALWDRDQGRCAECGAVTWSWDADHIIPVVQGGGGCWLDNLQTLCVPCHKRKTKAMRAP